MTRVEFRMTHPEDLVRMSFGGYVPLPGARFVGWTALAGRRVVGLGGVTKAADGLVWGYFMIADDYRGRFRVTQHRMARKFLRLLRLVGVPVHATCEAERPMAREWLERLGFVASGDGTMIFGEAP